MDKLSLLRLGGIAMLIGGLALGYSYISHPHMMTPETISSTMWFVIHLIFAISIGFGLIGTTALYTLTALRVGKVGLAGYLLVFAGMILIFGLDYYEFLIAPYLAVHYPAVINDWGAGDTMGPVAIAFPLSGAMTVVGYAILGIAWRRAEVLPGMVAAGLVVTALAFGFGLSPFGSIVVAQITAALFGVALVTIGVCALLRRQRFVIDALNE